MTEDTKPPGGWPDPERPGVPENPERDGAHVIHWFGDDEAWLWFARRKWWVNSTGRFLSDLEVGRAYGSRYLGPCLFPAEVAAREAAARAEGMREAVNVALATSDGMTACEIPAATLAGLRDGSLVAVPREPTSTMLNEGGTMNVITSGKPTLIALATWNAMLAAAFRKGN